MKRALSPLLSVAIWISAHAVTTETAITPPGAILSGLEARASKENSFPDATAGFHLEVVHLVESNVLESAGDFYRAAMIASGPLEEYRATRMRHELMLVAAVKESREAEKELMNSWDSLLRTLSRPMRFDPFNNAAQNPDSGLAVDPAPAAIQAVWRNPDFARIAASKAADNAELQKIVDADQEIRKNWNQLSATERQQVAADDVQRNLRTRAIVVEGALHTAKDFTNASLVMQHSSSFAGFQLAHELAVCAMLLGDRGLGRWLVAATYDRMLNSAGHDQRFGTQGALMMKPQKPFLRETDEAGICDAERLALGCATLAAKRADFFARPPSP